MSTFSWIVTSSAIWSFENSISSPSGEANDGRPLNWKSNRGLWRWGRLINWNFWQICHATEAEIFLFFDSVIFWPTKSQFVIRRMWREFLWKSTKRSQHLKHYDTLDCSPWRLFGSCCLSLVMIWVASGKSKWFLNFRTLEQQTMNSRNVTTSQRLRGTLVIQRS